MSKSAGLLQLQALDLELDAHRARVRAIEVALGDDPVVRAAKQNLVETQTQMQVQRGAVQKLEYEAQALGEKIAATSERMYSGHVTNPKELQDLQHETLSLRKRQEALEENQFSALMAAETAETQHAASLHGLQLAEAATAAENATLLEERSRLEIEIQRQLTARDGMLSSILAGDLEVYERLRISKKGRAVAKIDEGACGACGVEPSSSRLQDARQGHVLIVCGNCGRILAAD
jgi:predicted  nucleic acid-binding Zn-ribbon protein